MPAEVYNRIRQGVSKLHDIQRDRDAELTEEITKHLAQAEKEGYDMKEYYEADEFRVFMKGLD